MPGLLNKKPEKKKLDWDGTASASKQLGDAADLYYTILIGIG